MGKQQQAKPAKQPKQPRKPLLGFLGRGKDKKASSTESAFLEVPHDSESSTGGSFTEDAVLNPGKSTLTSEYLCDSAPRLDSNEQQHFKSVRKM